MQETYDYDEPELLKTPYVTLFLNNYNTKYTNSYALGLRADKENNTVSLEQKKITVFYNPQKISREQMIVQVSEIRKQILSNTQKINDKIKISEATIEQIIEHQKQASSKQ